MIDADNSGSIEFDEFVKAIENWLTSDVKPDADETVSGSRKRKKSNDDERLQVRTKRPFNNVCFIDSTRSFSVRASVRAAQIHKKVRSFFTQFQTSSAKLDAIRDEMRADQQQQLAGGAGADNDMLQDFRLGEAYTSAAKLEFLVKFRTTMESFASIVATLRQLASGTSIAIGRESEALELVNCLAQCLSICEVFASGAERRAVADDIVQLFELLARLSVVPALVVCLRSSPAVAASACRCVRLIAPGPRIASTPEDSLLHPAQMFFKKLVISEGVVPILIALLSSPVVELCEQSALALASIASHDPAARDFVLAANALPALLQLIQSNTPLTTVRKVVFTIAILVGVTHPLGRLPKWELVQPALERQVTKSEREREREQTRVCMI